MTTKERLQQQQQKKNSTGTYLVDLWIHVNLAMANLYVLRGCVCVI